ncbi:MAG: hypothetical protein ABI378_01245, partial [Chitinophagaceae bacterium]
MRNGNGTTLYGLGWCQAFALRYVARGYRIERRRMAPKPNCYCLLEATGHGVAGLKAKPMRSETAFHGGVVW